LYLAALQGEVSVARSFVRDFGANIDLADQDGCTPLNFAAEEGHLAVVQCLIKEFGADVNLVMQDGSSPLYITAQEGHLAVMRCLVMEGHADINQALPNCPTPLCAAAQKGSLDLVRCLVEDFGADVKQAGDHGATPLIMAPNCSQSNVVAYLLRHGADSQASVDFSEGMSLETSTYVVGAPPEQTAYLDAKTHCYNPSCNEAGLKKCTGCKQVRYCGAQCQLAHWPVHKTECKEAAKNKSEYKHD
jgi:ankyrin repeat protein